MTIWVPIGEDIAADGFNTSDGSIVGNTPTKLDMKLVIGITNTVNLTFKGIDTTGYTFEAPIVDDLTDTKISEFTVATITEGISLTIAADQVGILTNYTKLQWDLDVTPPTAVERTWFTGTVTFINTGEYKP